MPETIRVLDLYCGAGGSAAGIERAFDEFPTQGKVSIVGVDIEDQPDYHYEILKQNVLDMAPVMMSCFDFIWASPPCQAYSRAATHSRRHGFEYPNLIQQTRDLLLAAGRPFVIENVPLSPIRIDLMLCGTMFDLKVFRHRHFEIEGFPCRRPVYPKHNGRTGTDRWPYKPVNGYVQVTGGNFTVKQAQGAMGIDWISNRKSLAQAIPPAYSKYIFTEYLKNLVKDESYAKTRT